MDRGIPLQIQWADPSSIDPQYEGLNWEVHGSLLGETPTVGVYRCAEGHQVGAPDTETLIGWLELAVEEQSRVIPIPELVGISAR